jgi:CRISPR-associated protein (TIGR02584 family)
LATVGLNPQILTETLYALAVKLDPPFVPTEIHAITTAEGRQRIMLTLLDEGRAILRVFAGDFALTGLAQALTKERIYTVVGTDGKRLDDIASEADNVAVADLTAGLVRELTADSEAALHVSIAGGRKTMGFLLGTALSLFGRRQDRLSHVLVASSFEQHPDFFYPPPVPRVLTGRAGEPLSTADAHLILADIPFVRLRAGLPEDLLSGAASYSQAIASAQAAVNEPGLLLDPASLTATCDGRAIRLRPALFAVYAWLARRRRDGAAGDGSIHWSDDAGWNELVRLYRSLPGVTGPQITGLTKRVSEDADRQTLVDENKSSINAVLRSKLGARAELYAIGSVPHARNPVFERSRLSLPPEAIHFVDDEAKSSLSNEANESAPL